MAKMKPSMGKKTKSKFEKSNAKKWANESGAGWTPTAFKVPDGMKLFKFRAEKLYRLDMLGYVVGKGNPMAKEGAIHFERTYYVHQNVGPRREAYCCLLKNWNKKCPICDHCAKLHAEGRMDKKAIGKLEAKMRHLWLVKDLDAKEEGFKLWETGHFKTFGEQMKDRLDALRDDSPNLDFFMPVGGATLNIKAKQDTFSDGERSGTFYKASNIDFDSRSEDYSDEDVEALPCLDDLLIQLSYKELEKKFHAQDAEDDESEEDEDTDDDESEEEDEDEKPSKKKAKSKKPDDDDDEEEDEDSDSEEESDDEEDEPAEFEVGDVVKTKSKYKGKVREGRLTKVDEKRDVYTFTDEDGKLRAFKAEELVVVSKAGEDDEDEPEDEEDETPPPKAKKGKKKPPVDDDDEDDDSEEDEDEEDDEPPAKKGKGGKSAKKSKKDEEEDESEDEDDDDDPIWNDDEDDESEEDDDEPPAKKKRKK